MEHEKYGEADNTMEVTVLKENSEKLEVTDYMVGENKVAVLQDGEITVYENATTVMLDHDS